MIEIPEFLHPDIALPKILDAIETESSEVSLDCLVMPWAVKVYVRGHYSGSF